MQSHLSATRIGGWLAGALAVAALMPGGATAAPARPTATTEPATAVGQQSARLTGTVDPNERATTYFFEYGPTTAYGATTAELPAGDGDAPVSVAAEVGGLAPATRYHFRLVARNVRGVDRGRDRSLRTERQPLGLSLAATPNPVRPNGSTTIVGTLAGTNNGARQVILLANPFPFTQGFLPIADPHVTNVEGRFSFPILSVPVNTQYRVSLPGAPLVASPVVTVGVTVRVSASVRVRRTRGRARVRISGRIRPAHDGALVAIQRLRRGAWVTIDGTIARAARGSSSRYAESVTVGRSATLRVLADLRDGDHIPTASRTIRVRMRR